MFCQCSTTMSIHAGNTKYWISTELPKQNKWTTYLLNFAGMSNH